MQKHILLKRKFLFLQKKERIVLNELKNCENCGVSIYKRKSLKCKECVLVSLKYDKNVYEARKALILEVFYPVDNSLRQ